MTQTQTTAERIDALINNGVLCECEGVPPGGPMHGVWKVAAIIAAEIDALTAERDDARAEVAKLKEQNRILATTSLRDVIKSVHPGGRARGQ